MGDYIDGEGKLSYCMHTQHTRGFYQKCSISQERRWRSERTLGRGWGLGGLKSVPAVA